MNARVSPAWSAGEIRRRHPNARLRLIRAREDAGLTRSELALRLGMSRFFVFSVETGRRTTKLARMAQWAAILEIPLEFFLASRRQPPPAPEPVPAPVETAAA